MTIATMSQRKAEAKLTAGGVTDIGWVSTLRHGAEGEGVLYGAKYLNTKGRLMVAVHLALAPGSAEGMVGGSGSITADQFRSLLAGKWIAAWIGGVRQELQIDFLSAETKRARKEAELKAR